MFYEMWYMYVLNNKSCIYNNLICVVTRLYDKCHVRTCIKHHAHFGINQNKSVWIFFAFNRLKTHFLRMQLTSSVPAYSYHMVHVNVYGLFYFYVILYTMHTMYISAICILLVNRNSLKTGRSGRSRDRPVYRESTVYIYILNTNCD